MSASILPASFRTTTRTTFVRLSILLAALAALTLFAGCAQWPAHPYATEAETIAAHGQPVRRWANADGTTTLEYSTQPGGTICMMVTVDAAGRVLRQADALTVENLARVSVGMTREEVSHMLGRHRTVEYFPRLREEVWDWNIDNSTGPGIATLFNVHFIDGKVARTSQTYIHIRGDNR